MMFTPRSLLILIAASAFLTAGEPRMQEITEKPRSSYGLGSAKYLEGKNLLYSLFVDTPQSTWSPEEKAETLKNLNKAAFYIEETAREYDRETELVCDWQENADLTGSAAVDFEIADEFNFMDKLDAEIGVWAEDLVDYDGLTAEYQAEGIAMLVFVNNPGTSYAIVYDGTDNPKESVIFFAEEPPAVYAHEILHLFGAHDLYRDAEYSREITDYIEETYPMEIMRTVTGEGGKTLEDAIANTVSPLTAYHLGWIEQVEETESFPQLKR
ncbi:MAG: hypothetical protein NC429_05010 [Lachnospiraceae bacterium]|nr:hypothetical protein [Lachnospiraceae bacterium]